jgi:hypothetical protein
MPVPLTDARRGELALLFLKYKLKKEGISLKPDLRREVGNMAKAMDIPFEEAFTFVEEMTRGLLDEVFTYDGDKKEGEATK